MKILAKEDLITLMSLTQDRDSYSLRDFERLLGRFGDDYFIVDGRWKKTSENEEMANIRDGKNICVEDKWNTFRRDPYKSPIAAAYVTAINILAVEYLIKTDNREEYSRRVHQVYELTEDELDILDIYFSLNMHTSSLGAMITQHDYDHQREVLLDFLDHPEERL